MGERSRQSVETSKEVDEKARRKFQLERTAASLSIPLRRLEGEEYAQIQQFVGIVLDTDNITKDMERVRRVLERRDSLRLTQVAYTTAITILEVKKHILRDGFNDAPLNLEDLQEKMAMVGFPFNWKINRSDNFYSKGYASEHWQSTIPQIVSVNQTKRGKGWWEAVPKPIDRVDPAMYFDRMKEKKKILPVFLGNEGDVALSHIVELEELEKREKNAQQLSDVPGIYPVARARFIMAEPLSRLAKLVLEDSFRKEEDKQVDRIEIGRALIHVSKHYGLPLVDMSKA